MKLITQEKFYKKTKWKCVGCELPELLGFRCGDFTCCDDCGNAVVSFISESWKNEIQNGKNEETKEAKTAKITLEELMDAIRVEDARFWRFCDVADAAGVVCNETKTCNECRKQTLHEIAVAWEEDAR